MEEKHLNVTCALQFLLPEDVKDAFVDLFVLVDQDKGAATSSYFDYILENYMCEDSTKTKYPPILWAGMEAFMKRITNGCEAFPQ